MGDDRYEDGEVERLRESLDAHLGPASDDQGVPGHDLARASARRAQAVALRLAGMTYEEIAVQAGYSDKSAARHAVLRALDRVEAESVQEYRELENARLDRAQAAIWTQVVAGDIKAVLAFLRLSARRARMNGLDAPQAVTVSTPDRVQLEAMIADFRTGVETVLGEVTDSHVIEGGPGEREEG